MPRRSLTSLVACSLALAAGYVPADEAAAYTLKLYKSKKGDKITFESVEKGKFDASIQNGGIGDKKAFVVATKESYTEEVLEKGADGKDATKLSRAYTTAETTTDGKVTSAVYAGKTVVIEKKKGGYVFTVKGKALTKKRVPGLFEAFNGAKATPQDQDLLPT
jgi:hypothetical protein